mgnify:FL=1
MFSRYHRMLTDSTKPKSDQKCPLCKRQFSEEEEVDELVSEVSRWYSSLTKLSLVFTVPLKIDSSS